MGCCRAAPEHMTHNARHTECGILAHEGAAVLVQWNAGVALERAAAGQAPREHVSNARLLGNHEDFDERHWRGKKASCFVDLGDACAWNRCSVHFQILFARALRMRRRGRGGSGPSGCIDCDNLSLIDV